MTTKLIATNAYPSSAGGQNDHENSTIADGRTPKGQAPEALDDLYLKLHGLSKRLEGSGRIDEGDAPEAYPTILNAMILVRMLQCEAESSSATHVQNPAEIEHVAGDVSKNGAGLDTTPVQPVAQQGAAKAELPTDWTAAMTFLHDMLIGQIGPLIGVAFSGEEASKLISAAYVITRVSERPNETAKHMHALRTQQPAPAGAVAMPLLVRDIAADFGVTPVQVCLALVELGFGHLSVNMAITPEMAEQLREHFAVTPQPAPVTQQAGDDLAELSLLNRLIELGGKAAGAHATSNSDDGPKGTAAYVQWQELRAEIGELIRRFYSASLQPPTAQAASSTVLGAIRKANMQLVRTGDNAFMLVPYKVATAQAAGNVPAISDLPPLPDPDLRDVGTKPQDVKDFLNGYATEYARLALAARAPAESVPAVLGDDELVKLGKSPESGLPPWGIGTTRADYLRAVRAVLAAARAPAESVLEDALNRLLEAATEIVETVECYDPNTLLALDEDPHSPSAINASSDNLKHAIVSIRAAMAANGGNK